MMEVQKSGAGGDTTREEGGGGGENEKGRERDKMTEAGVCRNREVDG
jgi:hypothetical protein